MRGISRSVLFRFALLPDQYLISIWSFGMFYKVILLFFAAFLIGVGLLMILRPVQVREIIKKGGSTPLIHFSELTLRAFPGFSFMFYENFNAYSQFFYFFGAFMVLTSFVLMVLPRSLHHRYALWSASYLPPVYIRLLSPVSIVFGVFIFLQVS